MHCRNVVVFFLAICIGRLTECRSGWKTSKNGYFIYKATRDASLSETLKVNGTFSVKQYSRNHNAFLTVEDSSGNFVVQVSFDNGWSMIARKPSWYSSPLNSWKAMPTTNFGFPFFFEIICTQKNQSSRYLKKVDVRVSHGEQMTHTLESYEDSTWNLENATIYLGGYNREYLRTGDFFEGCISGVMFQGIDIIGKYFQQYPSNKNPVRGSRVVGAFSNVSQICDDKSASSLAKIPCWKTDGKCFLSYKMTPANSIGVILNITMKYSTTIFSQKNNMLFVIANEHFKLGLSVEKDDLQSTYAGKTSFSSSKSEILGLNSGAVITQEILIMRDSKFEWPYLYYAQTPTYYNRNRLLGVPNFANLTVHVGGINNMVHDFFDNCIHSAFINGFDVVGAYLRGGSQKNFTKECLLDTTATPTKSSPSKSNSTTLSPSKATYLRSTPSKSTSTTLSPSKATSLRSTPSKSTSTMLTPSKPTPSRSTPITSTPTKQGVSSANFRETATSLLLSMLGVAFFGM
ncbi:uncharacterized protein LOC135685681 [Rhopilema esculentum]|uniref:uncharacterized protein LOC135685681 n=1 Tax=Rhopilema esculentum TaxID=499914 RepID=UPI0031D7CA01